MHDTKSPDELRAFAREVAQKTKKPFDDILLKETKTKNISTEFKGGFLGLQTKTKIETQKYVETQKYHINCWILDKYTETDVENDNYFSQYIHYYALRQNGDLIIIFSRSKGWGIGNDPFYESSSAEIIDNMTFLEPKNWSEPIVQVDLMSLLSRRSAYLLDVAHCNWKTIKNKDIGDYILRDYPISLRSEGGGNGAGEYKYRQGEGLYLRLESLMKQ